MARETTETLIARHKNLVDQYVLADNEMNASEGPKWLRAHDRKWSFQHRMWKIEDVLMKRAEDDEAALTYMASFFGVTL